MGHIIVDDSTDIIDINTTCHDIGSNEYIRLSCLEAIHHLVAFLLGEITMHLVAVDMHGLQTAVDLFHTFFLSREDNHTFQVTLFEDVVDDLQFLWVIADICTLLDFLRRLRNGNLHFYRIV